MLHVKRFFAVFLLIFVLMAVGYFVYTGSRFTINDDLYQEVFGATFSDKTQQYVLTISTNNTATYHDFDTTIHLSGLKVDDGVMCGKYMNETYRFVLVSKDYIYDTNSMLILRRRTDDG